MWKPATKEALQIDEGWWVGYLTTYVGSLFEYLLHTDTPFHDPEALEQMRAAPFEYMGHQNGVWFRRGPLLVNWNPKNGIGIPWAECGWYQEVAHSFEAAYQRWYWRGG